jgi:hypothetical protein
MTRCFFFYPLYTVNCCSTVSITKHGYTVDHVFFRMVKSRKERSFCFNKRLSPGFPSISLNTLCYHMIGTYFLIRFTCLIHAICTYFPCCISLIDCFPSLMTFPLLYQTQSIGRPSEDRSGEYPANLGLTPTFRSLRRDFLEEQESRINDLCTFCRDF